MWATNRRQDEINFEEQDLLWNAIEYYMDDSIREKVHNKVSPCSRKYFLEEYIIFDPNFECLIAEEFDIEWV